MKRSDFLKSMLAAPVAAKVLMESSISQQIEEIPDFALMVDLNERNPFIEDWWAKQCDIYKKTGMWIYQSSDVPEGARIIKIYNHEEV